MTYSLADAAGCFCDESLCRTSNRFDKLFDALLIDRICGNSVLFQTGTDDHSSRRMQGTKCADRVGGDAATNQHGCRYRRRP